MPVFQSYLKRPGSGPEQLLLHARKCLADLDRSLVELNPDPPFRGDLAVDDR